MFIILCLRILCIWSNRERREREREGERQREKERERERERERETPSAQHNQLLVCSLNYSNFIVFQLESYQ